MSYISGARFRRGKCVVVVASWGRTLSSCS